MIHVEIEPKELYEEFGQYEKCIFCNTDTKHWHEKTNEPICQECAAKYNSDHIELAVELNKIIHKKKRREPLTYKEHKSYLDLCWKLANP